MYSKQEEMKFSKSLSFNIILFKNSYDFKMYWLRFGKMRLNNGKKIGFERPTI